MQQLFFILPSLPHASDRIFPHPHVRIGVPLGATPAQLSPGNKQYRD